MWIDSAQSGDMKFNSKIAWQMTISVFIIWLPLLIGTPNRISQTSSLSDGRKQKSNLFSPVIAKLLKRGMDTSFLNLLISDYRTQFNEKFIKINVSGFLKKIDYSANYSNSSVRRCREFLRRNRKILAECEENHNVPKEVITAILWIETKFGKITGDYHVPSVFFSTAMADQPMNIELNVSELDINFNGDKAELPELKEKIKRRALKKSEWALNELMALAQLRKFSPIWPGELFGSWSGAFGLCQFLPSSYVKWGIDGNGDGRVNLFDLDDAVFSVGNYLKAHGWNDSLDARRQAVFLYNNSYDYVDAVMELARRLNMGQGK
ncbi:MAG: Membrane-bound lytic murein transglycosylase [Ignavibacteria bacterium]|nr:Membrane-bound lytic murein transglycosylase [Ignavibacteria bacterium]